MQKSAKQGEQISFPPSSALRKQREKVEAKETKRESPPPKTTIIS